MTKSQFREFLFGAKHLTGLLVAAATVAVLLFLEVGAVGQEAQFPVDGEHSVSALPETQEAPGYNPTTPAKVELGRLLFWDPLLSGPQDVACATCHHPINGYAEDRDLSLGVTGTGRGRFRRDGHLVKRNSPTVLNVAFNGIDESGYDPATAPMFWDNRIRSLESQALGPLQSFEEMRGDTYPEDEAVARVVAKLQANAEYPSLFAGAFGSEQPVTAENLGRAIAAFMRSLLANNSPFDRYMRGDSSAMTTEQVRGMQRFEEIGCIRCHNGPMFSDYKLHVMGVPDNPALASGATTPASDGGAQNPPCPAAPGEPRTDASRAACDSYAFRTASLRNLELTFPYGHNGMFRTLNAVVGFYESTIAGESRNPNVPYEELDQRLRELQNVDEEDVDLIEFLIALSDGSFDRTIPERVPSGLPVGGNIQ